MAGATRSVEDLGAIRTSVAAVAAVFGGAYAVAVLASLSVVLRAVFAGLALVGLVVAAVVSVGEWRARRRERAPAVQMVDAAIAGGRTAAGERGVAGGPVVFVSASVDDDDRRKTAAQLLAVQLDGLGVRVCSERRGEGDEQRRLAEIARASGVLVLVSASYVQSSALRAELGLLAARGIAVVGVLVDGDVGLRDDPRLGSIEWPPIEAYADAERDDWVRGLFAALDLLGKRVPAAGVSAPDERDQPRVLGGDAGRGVGRLPALTAGEVLGTMHDVPAPPPGFVARAELAQLRHALVDSGTQSVAITGGRGMGLYGQGGIGKSVLAAALARDEQLRRFFADGVFWVTLGERPQLVREQIALLEALGVPTDDLRRATDGRDRLVEALQERCCLVVVDDVWSAAAAQAFDVCGRRGRVLYTTRDRDVLRAVDAQVSEIGVLPDSTARRLLAQLAATSVEELPAEVDRVLAATGRVALALAVVGALVGRGARSWARVADELQHAGRTFLASIHRMVAQFRPVDKQE